MFSYKYKNNVVFDRVFHRKSNRRSQVPQPIDLRSDQVFKSQSIKINDPIEGLKSVRSIHNPNDPIIDLVESILFQISFRKEF